jgi:hypothetical protein
LNINARIITSVLFASFANFSGQLHSSATDSSTSARTENNPNYRVTLFDECWSQLQSNALSTHESLPDVSSEALLVGPANDAYPGAINIIKGRRTFSTVDATRSSTGQGATACWTTGGVDKDIWYLFEADKAGTWTASLCDSSASDTRIVVYGVVSGSAPGSAIACGDNQCGNHASTTFHAEEGQVFYIQIGTQDSPGTADGILDLISP